VSDVCVCVQNSAAMVSLVAQHGIKGMWSFSGKGDAINYLHQCNIKFILKNPDALFDADAVSCAQHALHCLSCKMMIKN